MVAKSLVVPEVEAAVVLFQRLCNLKRKNHRYFCDLLM